MVLMGVTNARFFPDMTYIPKRPYLTCIQLSKNEKYRTRLLRENLTNNFLRMVATHEENVWRYIRKTDPNMVQIGQVVSEQSTGDEN